MTSLGTLGGTSSSARGVSADGSVIVGESHIAGDTAERAFKYTGSTMTSLGTLGGADSFARGVSADGSVIVGDSETTGGDSHAFKYSGSTMTSLGTLGGTNSFASGVSANGSVIVGASETPGGAWRAFKYTGSTMTDLGTLGGTQSTAKGVSADGSVIVGYSDTAGGAGHAFKYSGSTMTDLGTLGGIGSGAYGVSADGSVIVGDSDTAGGATHAFKYNGSTMTDLGTLGGNRSVAYGVSADGSVIVGRARTTGGDYHAFKYTGSTMTDLGTLGGTISAAHGVSADGSVIVGESQTTGNTAWHAFVYRAGANGRGLVDVQNTYAALATQGTQLHSLLNAQNASLAVGLNYDCAVYGAGNVCIGVGGRQTKVSNPSASQTAANVQIGYRLQPELRVGAFLDQGITTTSPSNYILKNSQPLAGVFAVYAPTGTLGLQVKASGAHSRNGATITRSTLSHTEAGQGESTLAARGAQLEGAYGFAVDGGWIASPLLGIRTTKVTRNGYVETAGATFPITYNAVNQTAKTAYAGAKVFGHVTPQISVGASAGVEQDLSKSVDSYSGSIYYLGAFNQAAPVIKKTRAFAGVKADYWVEKDQRVSVGVHYSQQALGAASAVTAMLSYTVDL